MIKNKGRMIVVVFGMTVVCSAVMADQNRFVLSQNKAKKSSSHSFKHGKYAIYAEAIGMYSHVKWSGLVNTWSVPHSHDNGFGFGVAGGYYFSKRLSAEGGWIHLPKVDFKASGQASSVSSNVFYAMGAFNMPMSKENDLFVKAGVADRYTTNTAKSPDEGNQIGFAFALGTDYQLVKNIKLGFEYLHIAGHESSDPAERMPSADLFTGSLIVNFNV